MDLIMMWCYYLLVLRAGLISEVPYVLSHAQSVFFFFFFFFRRGSCLFFLHALILSV